MTDKAMRSRAHVIAVLSTTIVAAATGMQSRPAVATDGAQRSKHSDRSPKVYLLDCPADEGVWKLPPQGLSWQKRHQILDEKARQLIKIVDRSKVDPSLYVDVEGLRLYVSGRGCRKTFQQLPRRRAKSIGSAYLIPTLLGRRYGKAGIEPDRIPVHGTAGQKLGTKGMVFLKGGEYVRPGYYTSQSAQLGKRTSERYWSTARSPIQ